MKIGHEKSVMTSRIEYIRRDFIRQYGQERLEKLRLELCEEQNDLCILCGNHLQDRSSVITEIDHTISVYIFAESSIPIDEAARLANDRSNLAAAHVLCQRSKGALAITEWSERVEAGELELKIPDVLSRSEIEMRLANMGRPPVSDELLISQRIPIMVRKSEADLIRTKAAKEGKTVSDWGRRVLVKAAGGSVE